MPSGLMGASRGWRRRVHGAKASAEAGILQAEGRSRFFHEKSFHHEDRRVLRYAALLMKQAISSKASSKLEGRESKNKFDPASKTGI